MKLDGYKEDRFLGRKLTTSQDQETNLSEAEEVKKKETEVEGIRSSVIDIEKRYRIQTND